MMRSTLLAAFTLFSLTTLVSCSKGGLSDDDLRYIRASAGLMKLKSTLPQTADSTLIQPKLDSAFKAYGMTRESYIAFSEGLSKDPDHTQLIYNAIKDSLGLK